MWLIGFSFALQGVKSNSWTLLRYSIAETTFCEKWCYRSGVYHYKTKTLDVIRMHPVFGGIPLMSKACMTVLLLSRTGICLGTRNILTKGHYEVKSVAGRADLSISWDCTEMKPHTWFSIYCCVYWKVSVLHRFRLAHSANVVVIGLLEFAYSTNSFYKIPSVVG